MELRERRAQAHDDEFVPFAWELKGCEEGWRAKSSTTVILNLVSLAWHQAIPRRWFDSNGIATPRILLPKNRKKCAAKLWV